MSAALTVIGAVLLAAALLLAVPALVLLVQVVTAVGATSRPRDEPSSLEAPSPLAVLMPAHDEAAGIAASIATVRAQLRPVDRLLVVADNCSDDTVRVARTAGAEVVERHDTTRRGKGYALDFGVRALESKPPAVVVIVDADCAVAPQALARLAACCTATGRPVQALYLMHCPPDSGLKARIAELAWIVKNQVRPLGFHRLGLPCPLMGTGMAFPWSVICSAPLASGHLVEDMQLGLDLAAAGVPPVFEPRALVTSTFPSSAEALATQRTRWEHGHLAVIASVAPRLLGLALTRRSFALFAMALDLCVPPLASLVLGVLVLGLLAAGLALAGGSGWPLAIAFVTLVALIASVLLAWNGFARHVVTLAELLGAPAYAFAKLPIYLRLLKKRQTEWVRTKRSDSGEPR